MTISSEVSSHVDDVLCAQARDYLSRVLAEMAAPQIAHTPVDLPAGGDLALTIFDVLTSRRFCDLGRRKAQAYQEEVVQSLRVRIQANGAFRFFLDVGPGYHASTRPGIVPLSSDVGLSELLLLFQVDAFCREIHGLYAPGAHFFFVVDNVCALKTNDVPLEQTQGYVRQFRELIATMAMTDRVELVVESEIVDLEEYDRELAALPVQAPADDIAPAAVDNVARFLGRACTPTEAAERVERYRRTSDVTNRLLDRFVQGVHMTQRATGATLGFRSFPGGDQRAQVGELALTPAVKGSVRPVLLTTRNIDGYDCERLDLSDILPPPVASITVARPRTPEL
ncbi:MAG TPA: hypothetical protein VHD57_06165 [Vicinamibacterales bacterium]|jgi:hypothetical protein|nr:hypothetical protein [Vicinamibacterales bacterium]